MSRHLPQLVTAIAVIVVSVVGAVLWFANTPFKRDVRLRRLVAIVLFIADLALVIASVSLMLSNKR